MTRWPTSPSASCPAPVPQAGWARVKVRVASLNHHDIWTLRGVSSTEVTPPQILGCDAAGEVDGYGGEPPLGAPALGARVVVYPIVTCGQCAGLPRRRAARLPVLPHAQRGTTRRCARRVRRDPGRESRRAARPGQLRRRSMPADRLPDRVSGALRSRRTAARDERARAGGKWRRRDGVHPARTARGHHRLRDVARRGEAGIRRRPRRRGGVPGGAPRRRVRSSVRPGASAWTPSSTPSASRPGT